MGRGANPARDPMTRQWPAPAFREDERVSNSAAVSTSVSSVPVASDVPVSPGSPVGPFLLGTVIGGLAGAIVGTALSPHTRGFLVGLYHLVSRRLSSSERDQLRFELLLQ